MSVSVKHVLWKVCRGSFVLDQHLGYRARLLASSYSAVPRGRGGKQAYYE